MVLEKIESPKDLKNCSIASLETLATEIRELILKVVSQNGGHLASNLGIVELTIALHTVFDSPLDQFIFDTGHQCYAHKILTHRKDQFSTLRQHHGLSGFFAPDESIHDLFFSGHAGTALSLALGLAKARDHFSKSDQHVIGVIGDGSLTCGHTIEALNNVPKDLKRFILILNDNKMAIGKNVGHIKNILSRLVNHPQANHFYNELLRSLTKIPALGPKLAEHGQKFKETVKNLFSHTALFFEQFGFSYVGPIDGHDIKKIIDVLTALKDEKTPVLLHVLTTKGKGYDAAIENPMDYHGVGSFDLEHKLSKSSKITFSKIFGELMTKLASENPSLYALSPAMLSGSNLVEMSKNFPARTLDVGIAEGHCLTYAAALAKNRGLKVVLVIYSTFLQRALDQLFHDICLQNVPLILAIDQASLNGANGVSHHGIYDIGFLKGMPNLVIAQARNGQLLEELMRSSLDYNKPVAIRYPNRTTTAALSPCKFRPIGTAEILSQGEEVLIVALGHMHELAHQIQSLLKADDIYPTIVDPIFIKPLDESLLKKLISSHQLVVTLEDHAVTSGFGELLNSFMVRHHFSKKVLNFGIPDRFVSHGQHDKLYKELGLDASTIVNQIKKSLLCEVAALEDFYDHISLHQ